MPAGTWRCGGREPSYIRGLAVPDAASHHGAVAQLVERLHGMQEAARSSRASSTGMTAKVAGTPRKRRRSGFDSRRLHRAAPGGRSTHLGIEEDGNLPDSDSGETRFDSGGPDHESLAETD